MFVRLMSLGCVLVLGACSSTPGDDGDETGGDDTQLPADTSLESIEAFLATQSYRDWQGDPAVRGSNNRVNPHGDGLRVYFNATAVASGNDMGPAAGTMVVKEFYDMSGTQVGTAARLKTDADEWVHYCTNPGGSLCSAEGEPVYGVDTETACGFCHVDQIFAPVP